MRSWLFWLIIAVGVFFRFWKLDFQSFWFDELFSWKITQGVTLAETWATVAQDDMMPPGLFTLLWLVQKLWGATEWTFRMPSAVFGVAVLPLFYVLGERLHSRSVGLVAMAVAAGAWVPVSYSQECRPYSMLLFSTTLSFVCFLSLTGSWARGYGASARAKAGYALSAALCMYSHYMGAVVIFTQLLWALPYLRRAGWRVFGADALWVGAGAALLYSPWIPAFLKDFLTPGNVWFTAPPIKALLWYWKWLFNDSKLLSAFALALIGLFLGAQLWRFWRQPARSHKRVVPSDSAVLFLAFWLVFPPVLALVKSHLSTPMWTARNLIISAPAAYLLFAIALVELAQRIEQYKRAPLWLSRAIVPAIVLLFPAQMIFGADYYNAVTKKQYRESVAYAVERGLMAPDDLVVGDSYSTFTDYYLKRFGSNARVDVALSSAEYLPDLERELKSHASVTRAWCISCTDLAMDRLRNDRWREVESRQFYKTKVTLLERSKNGQ